MIKNEKGVFAVPDPSELVKKEKLSVDDIYQLRNYYLFQADIEQRGPIVVKQMVEDGFKNSQINLICESIQKFNKKSGRGFVLMDHLYSAENLNKLRSEYQQKNKTVTKQK